MFTATPEVFVSLHSLTPKSHPTQLSVMFGQLNFGNKSRICCPLFIEESNSERDSGNPPNWHEFLLSGPYGTESLNVTITVLCPYYLTTKSRSVHQHR